MRTMMTVTVGVVAAAATVVGVGLPTQALSVVSCASPTFCITSNGGKVLTYDGTGWGNLTKLPGGALSVSCPTSRFCAAVDGPYATLYHG